MKEPCFWRKLLTRSDLRLSVQCGRPLGRIRVLLEPLSRSDIEASLATWSPCGTSLGFVGPLTRSDIRFP